jgi:hypothetical protein
MLIKVGLENGYEARSIAWVLDHPGCFAYGKDPSEAIVRVPQAIVAYKGWIEGHPGGNWLEDLGDFDVRLVDVFEYYSIDDNFDLSNQGAGVNAWFKHDWKPLMQEDIQRGLDILSWSRQELLELVSALSNEQITREFERERWSISGIVRHVANAEWWYLDRLELSEFTRSNLPNETFDRLSVIRKRAMEVIPKLVGKVEVRGVDGEFWSPRKVLRRFAWHERDHIQHIQRLMTLL